MQGTPRKMLRNANETVKPILYEYMLLVIMIQMFFKV
jgi:hypothetical protein